MMETSVTFLMWGGKGVRLSRNGPFGPQTTKRKRERGEKKSTYSELLEVKIKAESEGQNLKAGLN